MSNVRPHVVDPRALIVHLEAPFRAYVPEEAAAREVVLAGLAWPMEYWVGLAIAWLEEGAPIDREVVAHLDQVAQKKQFSQSVRHRAFALARRWERGQQHGA